MDAAYNNKRYSSIRSIISEMNQYGKEDETIAREYRILAKNYADNFLNEIAASKKLLQLLERTKNVDILPYKSFSAEYSIKKVKYKMDSDDFMKYVEEYYEELEKEYTDILSKGYSDETTVAMLIDAKKDVNKTVSGKYKVE
jgi:phosphotransacetylase